MLLAYPYFFEKKYAYEYFRESRTSSSYNKIRIKPEKYKSGFTTNTKREKKKNLGQPQFWRVGRPTANNPIFGLSEKKIKRKNDTKWCLMPTLEVGVKHYSINQSKHFPSFYVQFFCNSHFEILNFNFGRNGKCFENESVWVNCWYCSTQFKIY